MSSASSRLLLQPDALRASVRRASGAAGTRLAKVPARLRAGYWAESGLVAVVLLSLVVVRIQLAPWQSGDYNMFLSGWFDYLRVHGFHALGQVFANYNMPYLYLLFLGSLVTDDALTTVKIIGAVSDLALALGSFALLRQFGLRRELALVASAATVLLPEVLMNSAAWGQADATYGALLVWALWAAVRNRAGAAWVLYALAFTFKLQAAFVLPAFVILHVTRRWDWRAPVLAVVAALATEIPALIAGRSLVSLLGIYLDQANSGASLTMNAPSIYALLPETEHAPLQAAGMYFALASVGLLSYLVLRAARRRALTAESVLLFVSALAMLAPYTLPLMHERYFYVGNVLLFIYAIVTRKLLPWALVAQAVAVSAYSPFLFGSGPALPMGQLTLVEGAVIFVVIRLLVRETEAFPARVLADAATVPATR